jgi:hypothetical protein
VCREREREREKEREREIWGETSTGRLKRKGDASAERKTLKETIHKREGSCLCYIFSLANYRWK